MSIDEDYAAALGRQIAFLDAEHARAAAPSQRRRIEAKMAELRTEIALHRARAETVDLAFARWKRALDAEWDIDPNQPFPETNAPYEVFDEAVGLWLPAEGTIDPKTKELSAFVMLPIRDPSRRVAAGAWRKRA